MGEFNSFFYRKEKIKFLRKKMRFFMLFSIQFLTANSLAKYDGVCECNVGYEQFVRVARKRNREVLWQFLENWCPNIRRCEVNGAFYNEGSHEDFNRCQAVQCSCPKRPSGTKSGHWVYVKGCRYDAQEIEGCQRK